MSEHVEDRGANPEIGAAGERSESLRSNGVYHDDRTWWGLPRTWEAAAAQDLVDDLVAIWRAQTGRLPSKVREDLVSLAVYFNPLAAGRRLRPALAALPVTDPVSPYSVEPLILKVGANQNLVTPEGRLVLDALTMDLGGSSVVRLGAREYQRAQVELLGLYRSWSQRRLRDVLRLQSDEDSPMLLPQSLGILLLLLINGNTSPERPMRRPSDPADLAVLDSKTQDAIAAFADTLSPPRATRRKDQYSLYRGYALTEARRRLGSHRLVVNGNDIFINEDAINETVNRIIYDLRRRSASAALAADSFDALLNAYRSARPTLAAYGIAFERPATTAALRQQILAGLSDLPVAPSQHTEPESLARQGDGVALGTSPKSESEQGDDDG
jgi:hypothetical protein